ncbi:MAG: ferrous iron transport protein B, partial [Elusimicrobia bacterium]
VMPGAAPRFVIDIPPIRAPQAGNVARKVASRLKWYLAEIVPMFVLATFVLFLLDKTGGLAALERLGAPLVQGWLGLPKEATGAFLTGFLRRDYGAAGFFQLHRDGMLSPRQVAVSLVTITLFMPCFAQWLMSLREHGVKVAAVTTALVSAYALGAAGAVSWAWRWLS